jgi:hypothetical protein
MELSRKVISKHWWKFFGFVLVLLLLRLAGFVVFLVGFLIAAPIAKAALMYAYEDLFGVMKPAPAGAGPAGTEVRPVVPIRTSGPWRWLAPLLCLAAAPLLIAAIIISAREIKHRLAEIRAREASALLTDTNVSAFAGPDDPAREILRERIEAARIIVDGDVKDKLLTAVATDAAKAGQADLVKDSLQQMNAVSAHDQAAHESARLLAAHDQRRAALEIAKGIADPAVRDQALSDLAQ